MSEDKTENTNENSTEDNQAQLIGDISAPEYVVRYNLFYAEERIAQWGDRSVRRHINCHRFKPGLRETLLTSLFDINSRQLCDIASVDAV